MIKRRGGAALREDGRALEEFVAAADKPLTVVRQEAPPEETFDKKARPTRGLNVRYTQYQHDLLKRAAEQEDVSQQKVVRRILWPALEELLSPGYEPRKPVKRQSKEPTTSGLNLRFNDYQHDLLKRAAEQEDVSMQKIVQRILWPALEELLEEQ